MSSGEKVKMGGALSAVFVGWVAFIYQMSEMLAKHTDWNQFRTPPGVSEILTAMFFALLAFGGALFADFEKLLALIKGRIQ